MLYKDRVYGKVEINDPLALAIIKSPSLERLKKISQTGYMHAFFPGTAHERFEHSVGVYLLLKKFGAPFEEQVAGLIHDVSHSAFSHCIDYILAKGREDAQGYQDEIFDKFVRKTDLVDILKKHDIKLFNLLNRDKFLLLEKELPDLCADRIDYSLREALIYKLITQKEAREFLSKLSVIDNHWVFKNYKTAKAYALLFKRLNDEYYAGIPTAVMFVTVRDYLSYALRKKYISRDDLYTDDKTVLRKVGKFLKKDSFLQKLSDRMNNKVPFKVNSQDYKSEITFKSRVVDPLFLKRGRVIRLSEADEKWKETVRQEMRPKKYRLKFED